MYSVIVIIVSSSHASLLDAACCSTTIDKMCRFNWCFISSIDTFSVSLRSDFIPLKRTRRWRNSTGVEESQSRKTKWTYSKTMHERSWGSVFRAIYCHQSKRHFSSAHLGDRCLNPIIIGTHTSVDAWISLFCAAKPVTDNAGDHPTAFGTV